MIEYLKNEEVNSLIKNSPSYQKSALTGLRKVKFTTYVKSGSSIRIESEPFLPGVVIGRNPDMIGELDGKLIYNEWPIAIDIATKNYGTEAIESLTEEITYHKKIATIKAIELTEEIMKLLNVQGDTLNIKVDWSPDPMVAKLGDFITDSGYSVSAHDMKSTYEAISPVKHIKDSLNKFRNSSSNSDTTDKLKP
ncbi:hypothetical protein GW796_00565 [archaeon]|nr:hypothetical protein [archaeon]NCQ50397.1 hypothetical protein [archaeon]